MPSIGELAAYPWIVGPANSPLREKWEQLFSGHRLPPAPIECGSVMIVGRLLTEGDYLTLLSPDQIGLQMRSGLLAMVGTPLPNSTRMIGYTIRRNWRPTIVQRRFLQLLEEITKDGPLVDWSRMNEWRDLANQPVSLA
jgi:DNA-binding transcriptional LysR family regulator